MKEREFREKYKDYKIPEELQKSISEAVKSAKITLKQYEFEYNKIQKKFENYNIVNGIISPYDITEFFSWISMAYPDENLPIIIEIAKKPNSYKKFHDYKERLFNNPDWSEEKEFEYLQKEIAEPQQIEGFSVPEWATIFYYADSANLLSGNNTDSLQTKLNCFSEKHKIKRSINSLSNEYYKIKIKINEKLNYSIEKLNKILPFMNEHYKQSIGLINNDITYLEENRSD